MEFLILNGGEWKELQLYLFGIVKFLALLAILMFLDVMTGIMKAIKNKRLRSRKALYGYGRKIGIYTAIILE
ncbi:phage holin family protein [Priestia flexa]|uniref:phage holin family protein n=1 Tax=Priestia flexa TaxID=86664 RepID=UPI003D7D10D2